MGRLADRLIEWTRRLACRTRPGVIDQLAQTWLNVHRGEGDSDMNRNGEALVMRKLLPSCKVVFDVGANVGQWAELARSINSDVTLHAFEPNPPIFEKLSRSEVAQQISLHRLGMSDAPGSATLHVYDQHHGMTSLLRRQGIAVAPSSTTEIELTTLDTFCGSAGINHIDWLKLDVEGHELAALRGGKGLLEQGNVGAIQFEYGGCHVDARTFLRDFFELLQPCGYHLFKIHPRGLIEYEAYAAALDNFQHQAWLAVHEESPLLGLARDMLLDSD